MAEPAALEDGKARAVNERHGDDHGVNLGKLRTFAKRLRTRHELAGGLWRTGDTAARLLATLICRPKGFGRDEPDVMVREARAPEVHDWRAHPRCTTGSCTTADSEGNEFCVLRTPAPRRQGLSGAA